MITKKDFALLELDLSCEKCGKRQTFFFDSKEEDKLMNKKKKIKCKFCGKEDTINGENKLMTMSNPK